MHIPEEITLEGFVLSGAGANGESYDCVDDPTIMLKLYNESYPVGPIYEELEIATKVYELGVPSPKPGKLVKYGNRLGIIFSRIQGKRSFSRALSQEPERVAEFAKEFAQVAKKLHSIHCTEGMFPKQKDVYLNIVNQDKYFTEAEKQKVRDFINAIPDYDYAIHGDLHIGNVLTTLPQGAPLETPHDIYMIDLGYFVSGCPLIDVSMVYNICIYASEEFRLREMHVGIEVTSKFWNYFVDEYFFGEEKLGEYWFGEGVTPEDVDVLLKPYMAVLLFFVGYNLGFHPEAYEKVIREQLL